MARKKKGAGVALVLGNPASTDHHESMSTDISTAENGFIVHVSGHKGGKSPSYTSKRFIAHTRPEAMRIAAHHFSSHSAKSGGKKKGKSHAFTKTLA